MTKNGSSALKRAVRARMAQTGENYTTALRRHQQERQEQEQAHEQEQGRA